MINDQPNKFKPKHSSIKFEEIEDNKLYAFTINPQNSGDTQSKLAFRKSAETLKNIKRDLSAISQCLKSSTITVTTEASALCKTHFHGTIRINSRLDWLTELPMLMQLGTVCIKEIDDEQLWFDYCFKQSHFWEDFYSKTNLAYPYVIPIPEQLPTVSDD